MGWSFIKSFGLLPGIRLNLSKSGPSLSFGIPGAKVSVDRTGRGRLNLGAGGARYRKAFRLPLASLFTAGRRAVRAQAQEIVNRALEIWRRS